MFLFPIDLLDNRLFQPLPQGFLLRNSSNASFMKDIKVYSDTRGGLPPTLLHKGIVTPVTPNVKSVIIILEPVGQTVEFSTLPCE